MLLEPALAGLNPVGQVNTYIPTPAGLRPVE